MKSALIILSGLAFFLADPFPLAAADKPNIIFILSDDLAQGAAWRTVF